MVLIPLAPRWFYGYDIALEVLFAAVSLIVAGLAYRIYKKTSQRNIGLFSLSFGLIGVSYVIQSVLNFLILSELNASVCRVISISSIVLFNNAGFLVHVFFMTLGLSLLTFVIFRTEDLRVLWVLMLMPLLAIFTSLNAVFVFYVFCSLMLIFITLHFVLNYLKKKSPRTLLVALAFLFLLIGNIHYLITVDHSIAYVMGHILELSAYVLIAINYYMIQK